MRGRGHGARRGAWLAALLGGLGVCASACGARSELIVARASDDAAVDASPRDGAARPPTRCAAVRELVACGRTPGCQWIVPGCGAPQPSRSGCFPVASCATDNDCELGLRCVRFEMCAGTPCSTCAPGAPPPPPVGQCFP